MDFEGVVLSVGWWFVDLPVVVGVGVVMGFGCVVFG